MTPEQYLTTPTLSVSSSDLLIFVDETGDEKCSDPNHPVFGLGGCAMMVPFYQSQFVPAWERMRSDLFNGGPLHASALNCTGEQQGALHKLFRLPFSRFVAISRRTTQNSTDRTLYELTASMLLNRFKEIARWQPFERLVFFFESSQRLDQQANQFFLSNSFQEEVRGVIRDVPVEWCRLSKQKNEPGLELADFVVNIAGRHVRKKMSQRGCPSPGPDYLAMFEEVDRRLKSWFNIDKAVSDPSPPET